MLEGFEIVLIASSAAADIRNVGLFDCDLDGDGTILFCLSENKIKFQITEFIRESRDDWNYLKYAAKIIR